MYKTTIQNYEATNKLFKNFSIFYGVLFLIPYAIVPYLFINSSIAEPVVLLAQLTLVSLTTFLIALNTSWGKNWKLPKLSLEFNRSIIIVFSIFILVVCVIFITAPHLPIIESLKGANHQDLVQYREDFLKGRQGWETSLNYIVGNITGAILPYFIALAFVRNHKYKFLFAFIFLLYCISFLEKAYFLKLAIPIFFIYFVGAKNKFLFIVKGSGITISFLAIMYFLSGSTYGSFNEEPFFSLYYQSSGTWETILWRTFVIPIITTLDALWVFINEFRGQWFYGSTSSFIAFITGQNWTNYDRYLYQYEFGGSETGSANATYLVEAYINFGMLGIILFSLLIGRLLRFVIKMRDIASLSILPLFIMNLFSASFIGTLLSGGFFLFFLMIRLIKFK